jgi:hypothetical protein
MKTAKEYLLQDFDHTALRDEHLDALESLIAAVQREAIKSAADICYQPININRSESDAAIIRERILALLPEPSP